MNRRAEHRGTSMVMAWLPLVALPITATFLRGAMAPSAFMWLMAGAIFAGLKWQTFWSASSRREASSGRSLGYLLLWPGMDAESFLTRDVAPPPAKQFAWALVQTVFGAVMFWVVAARIPAEQGILVGWAGMIGLIFLLHFGSFRLIALFWQSRGVCAEPIMRNPAASASLAEFWGKRWNLGFRDLAHELVFRPTYKRIGVAGATLLVFVVSGLIHELVISLPARGGYGLPTAYFVIQGVGVVLERRLWERGQPSLWWRLVVLSIAALPAYWLFHPIFVREVMLPFMNALGALQ